MSKVAFIVSIILLVVFCIFLCYDGWFILVSAVRHIELYKYVGIGFFGFLICHRFLNKNISWVKVFTHELTHTIVSIILFRKIHSFQAQEQEGVVYTSGNTKTIVFVALAPYCFPIYTYLMLFLWSLIASRSTLLHETLWAFDIIVGATIAFHALCFKEQTGKYQKDINQYPLFFSYLFIYAFRLFNVLVILLCYLPLGEGRAPLKIFGAFVYIFKNLSSDILMFF